MLDLSVGAMATLAANPASWTKRMNEPYGPTTLGFGLPILCMFAQSLLLSKMLAR